MDIQGVKTHLLSHGIKPSMHRITIMDYLLTHPTHPTVDDIYLALHDEIPTLSKTTIYNTLKLFVSSGVALSINIDEKNARYDGDTHTHAHFKCMECGDVFDFPLKEDLVYHDPEQMAGFKVVSTYVYHNGYCQACMEQQKNKQ